MYKIKEVFQTTHNTALNMYLKETDSCHHQSFVYSVMFTLSLCLLSVRFQSSGRINVYHIWFRLKTCVHDDFASGSSDWASANSIIFDYCRFIVPYIERVALHCWEGWVRACNVVQYLFFTECVLSCQCWIMCLCKQRHLNLDFE